ncbi:MAG: beta-ketoacyl-[acyl-carrier-protein] synthase family protein [Clostridia bacterium]|nr:beta-ketoacyl-[acyl-carrier-protein] synthase family protein [Clostridia bacterium]
MGNKKNRVVVTGVGVVSPIGNNVSDFWRNLVDGKSGCSMISLFDPRSCKCKIAAEVKGKLPELPPFLDYGNEINMSRATRLALLALAEALESAKIRPDEFKTEYNSAVILGAGLSSSNFHPLYDFILGNIYDVNKFEVERLVDSVRSGHLPVDYLEPFTCGYNPAATIASLLEVRGANRTISTACAAGTQAIGEAFRKIRNGDLDLVIAGGTDAMIDMEGFTLFSILNVMSTRNEQPEKASRPFAAGRDGFVLGEGSGILIMESLERALKRNAPILGEVIGYGCTTDTYHVTTPAPDGTACARTIKMALNDANIDGTYVDYINAHGTSTFYNDQVETLGIKNVFESTAYKIPVSSSKSMIGHLVSAAGAVEFIASLFSIRDGIIHPTINLEEPDPVCDLDYVPNKAREQKVNIIMSNSFGFGGQNVSIVGRRYEP